jgi:hypothetical protein
MTLKWRTSTVSINPADPTDMFTQKTWSWLVRSSRPSRSRLPYFAIFRRSLVTPTNPLPFDSNAAEESEDAPQQRSGKIREAIATTITTLACLGIAGYSYHKYYKWLTLRKIENAFKPGDPALDLIPRIIGKGGITDAGADESHWVRR